MVRTFLLSPHKVAGILSLLAAALVLAVWCILLFVAQPSSASVVSAANESLAYLLSAENPSRSWFIWLAIAPVVSTALGLVYLFGPARSLASAVVLFVAATALGVSGFYFVTWSLAFFVALPCYWGFLCVRINQGQAKASDAQ
jgi:riboflavin transporter FmnP